MVQPWLLLLVLSSVSIRWASSHQESGDWTCESDPGIALQADFRAGLITLDGHADDWKDIDGSEFSLRPALDPDEDKEYKNGKLTVKALHDGKDVLFLLQVDGNYVYSKGWVVVRKDLMLAPAKLAKAMKLTSCTSQSEMLFQDGYMVGI